MLFLAVNVSVAAGSPWFEHLGLDPGWLLQDGADTASLVGFPVAGASVRSSSDLALRSPLGVAWKTTEIIQTVAGAIQADSVRWTSWVQTSQARQDRTMDATSFSLVNPSTTAGLRAGVGYEADNFRLRVGVDQEVGAHAFSGALGFSHGAAHLQVGATRSTRRSTMRIFAKRGELALNWMDVSDSLGVFIAVPVGQMIWNAKLWSRTDASPVAQSLTDTGSATGWSIGATLPTEFGDWGLGYEGDRSDLHTLGSSEGRIFHDQDWRTFRVGIDATWEAGAWLLAGTTRQIRLELPYGGLDRPFVHWNMIPKDVFNRVAGVLEDQSDYLSGSFRIEHWALSLSRRRSWKSISVTSGLGASWIGFDAVLERSTLDVRGLFPSVTEAVPCDGSGWIAVAQARTDIEWKTAEAGVVRFGGIWRQPLIGRWNSRGTADNGTTENLSKSKNVVDPLGFHSWHLEWILAW